MHAPNRIKSPLVFLAFFCALFLFFTPFEQGGPNPSMLPRYVVAGASLMLLLPLLAIRSVRLHAPTMHVSILLSLIVLHATLVISGPGQFALLIAADMSAAMLLFELSFLWRREFHSAITWLLAMNVLFIGLQAFLFYATSAGMIDFYKMLFGSDSRFSEDYLNITRFSGFQVEPGTYANYMGCLLAIMMLTSEFSERLLLLTCLSIVGIFLTNSASSIYFVPLVTTLGLYVWRKEVRPRHLIVLAAAIGTYLIASGIVTHLEERFIDQPSDGSLTHRMDGVAAYRAMSGDEKFLGIGFVRDPCVGCHYQDIGVLFNLVTRGGATVSLALLGVLVRMIRVNGLLLAILLVLVPLNEKMFFYEPSVWLFTLFALTGPSYVRRRSAVELVMIQPGRVVPSRERSP